MGNTHSVERGLRSPARVADVLRHSVGAAATVAEELFEARRPAVARRLWREERRTETVAAALLRGECSRNLRSLSLVTCRTR